MQFAAVNAHGISEYSPPLDLEIYGGVYRMEGNDVIVF